MSTPIITGRFESVPRRRSDPMVSCEAVSVPGDDVTPLTNGPSRGVLVTVAGNIACIFEGDTASVVMPVLASVEYRWAIKQILNTGTTATGIKILR